MYGGGTAWFVEALLCSWGGVFGMSVWGVDGGLLGPIQCARRRFGDIIVIIGPRSNAWRPFR
ncbi:MAG: hypothetical protein CMQ35_08015 [Gammaproteobacteria bacterium]|nr:hypothetical protein [Gammaproteobacteria bacterium]